MIMAVFIPKYKGPPLPDELFIEDAVRIVEEAEKLGIILRVIGALAIRIHSMDYAWLHNKLGRLESGQTFSDIDFMCYGKHRGKLKKFFEGLGYIPDRYIITLFGDKRHIYYHPKGYYHIDVFFDKLEFSHDVNFKGRLELDKPTISLADLVLEKLQIHAINEKDIKDLIVLFRAHELGDKDENEIINAKYIAEVLADDWGFWYDATQNLDKLKKMLVKYANEELVDSETLNNVMNKVDRLLQFIEEEPKTKRWMKRAKTGTKKIWYRPVEDLEV